MYISVLFSSKMPFEEVCYCVFRRPQHNLSFFSMLSLEFKMGWKKSLRNLVRRNPSSEPVETVPAPLEIDLAWAELCSIEFKTFCFMMTCREKALV